MRVGCLIKVKEPLFPLTPNSITSLKELKKKFKEIREQGYAFEKEEYKSEVSCFSVPIINKKGKAIAAISVTAPSLRFTAEKAYEAKSKLIATSKAISKDRKSVV